MKHKYRIYIYELGDEYLYEVIEQDDAEAALKELIGAVNQYHGVRVRIAIDG